MRQHRGRPLVGSADGWCEASTDRVAAIRVADGLRPPGGHEALHGQGCVRVALRIMEDDPLVVDVEDDNEVVGTGGAVRAGLIPE